jgi:hypothetical protein
MTTFIFYCNGDPEIGIKGEVATVQFDVKGFNRDQMKRFKKGLSEVLGDFWNAGPVKVKQLNKTPK